MDSQFIQTVRDKLSELQRNRDELQAKIKPIVEQLEKLKAEEVALAAYLQVAGQNGGGGEPQPAPLLTPKAIGRLKQMGLADATVCLLGLGDPLKKGDIYARFEELGYRIKGNDPRQNLGSTLWNLRQAGRIERDTEGRYYVTKKEAPATT